MAIGKRRLGLLEKVGLLGMAPVFHLHYSKMDKGDRRAVLSKRYDEEDPSPQADIVRRRQESVRKEAVFGEGALGIRSGPCLRSTDCGLEGWPTRWCATRRQPWFRACPGLNQRVDPSSAASLDPPSVF